MAQENPTWGTCNLNSQKYNLLSHPVSQYVSALPSKVNTGDDSYSKQNYLSSWIISDQTGGIGISEMDESIHADRCWWSNCIIDWPRHIKLPRKATSVTPPTFTALTIANADCELDSDWTTGSGTWDRDNTQNHTSGGTYSWRGQAAGQAYQDLAWNNKYRNTVVQVHCWIYTAAATAGRVSIAVSDDGGSTTTYSSFHTGAAGWEELTVTRVISATATGIRLGFNVNGGNLVYFDDIHFGYEPISTTTTHFANFNSVLYVGYGNILSKLASDRSSIDVIYSFPANITALIPSLNSRLYIFIGDSDEYFSMTTAEAFTETNANDATLGIQWDAKLWKQDVDGNWWYSTDPESATPTWTSRNGITDIASQIETLLIGPDADGNDIIYCATNTWLKAHDMTNNKWVDTKLKLPDHPNGGKGACYWHGGIYVSYGLGVKQYVPGSTATISEVGLLKDDGLPVEYNGEFVKLLGESASDVMFGLVDASQTSGNSKSGLYAYDGRTWKCWWADSSNNGAMHDCIVSSASSSYAVYWDVGGKVYYIDIHRGISNPEQLAGTQAYEAAGIHISPWYDRGTPVFDKLANLLTTWAKDITTSETIAIKYRTDGTCADLDSGWTTIETLNTTAENGENEEIFASGAGIVYNSFQIRLDLARGATTTLSPDLQSLVLSSELLTGTDGNWIWTLRIPLDDSWGTSAKQKKENLDTAIQLGTLVPLKFREGDSNEPYYVRLYLNDAWQETGHDYEGIYVVKAVKL
uniref:Uncharacterized protein n=1 Tax=viral metagenome TaxID=1070528 RepID=A0A6M3KEN0_9ZZZZ